jgi:hypothetical protein
MVAKHITQEVIIYKAIPLSALSTATKHDHEYTCPDARLAVGVDFPDAIQSLKATPPGVKRRARILPPGAVLGAGANGG